MPKKWKDLLAIAGTTGALVSSELVWTGFLVWGTSKIPYVGIPLAAILGVTGVSGALWMGGKGRSVYKNWQKEYYTKS
jgi:hypothetical protein